MAKKMLIDAARSDEVRVALVENNLLTGLEIETAAGAGIKGNVYKGIVTGIEPALGASFIDFGTDKHGFLPADDIRRDLAHKKTKGPRPDIRDLLHRRQDILVQVVKDPVSTKGAALTTFISLAGRYTVLMPGADGGGGVSRKLDDEGRQRLREILDNLKIPDNASLILRTTGVDQTKASLQRDVNRLGKLWSQIQRRAEGAKAPSLIYREGDLVLRALRDYFDNDVSEVLISSPGAFERAAAYCKSVMPNLQRRVRLYDDAVPLFARFQIEEQVAALAQRRVPLPSGGSLVIDPTEALVAIDVNSGRTRKDSDHEETALRTNLEAAAEIARQLKLRDLGGIIAIDFIDLFSQSNRRKLEKAMKDAMKTDRAKVRIGRISDFGVLELTRQRLKKTARSQSHQVCPTCEGSGWIRSIAAAAVDILRQVRARAARDNMRQIRISLHPEVAEYLQNGERAALLELEQTFDLEIVILFGPGMTRDQQEIEFIPATAEARGPTRGRGQSRNKSAVPAEPLVQETELDSDEPEFDDADPQDPAQDPAPAKKARKRRPRKRKKTPQSDQAQVAEKAEPAPRVDAPGNKTDAPGAEAAADPATPAAAENQVADGSKPGEAKPPARRRRRGRRGGRGRKKSNGSAENSGSGESNGSGTSSSSGESESGDS